MSIIVDDLICGAAHGAHEFRNDARICECGETARPRKQAIAIDLDHLRELMREFLDEMQHRGHVTEYGPDSLSDWKFETFLQWVANRQRPPANLLHFEAREEG